ncbi:MAG: hypothetical protein B9J98_01045 [Candidatus Terraquivivens tikiterensis]|uniref:Polymerase nucleotidyl transferase domain-containing protein n=1 Tax=Candidatus Terraquivivens tikiterensis TaxID=1980982 RepID=A0A2R7Y9X8_9ARCH|nr:MAG: hypothetical protein B9J98_01045 [Candidatus Terraquivivens tikiterensis]
MKLFQLQGTLTNNCYDVFIKRILTALRDIGVGRFSDLRKVVKNPRTLTIKLEKLERLGLLKREAGGYRLTEKGLRVEATLEELEKVLNLPDLEVKNIERIPHAYFAPIIKRYSEILRATLAERLISIMLFGSVARGDWDKNSDIDILVVAEGWDARPVWERIEELKGAREILEKTPEYLKALKMGLSTVSEIIDLL